MEKLVAMVKFEQGGLPYNFLTDIEGLEEGDKLVVRSTNGLGVVTFIKYGAMTTGKSKATKWVIDKIDFTSELKREKRKEIEAALTKAIEETSILERAKQLAALNPEIGALIAALEAL